MSWSILSEESAKKKAKKRRKRRIKRGSKRGRYVVLGSRARNGRKSALHCVTCGNTLTSNVDGLICSGCKVSTEQKVAERKHSWDKPAPQMSIPKMTGQK